MAYDPTGEEAQILGARAQSLNMYRQLLSQRDGKLATLRETVGPASDQWKRAEDKLQELAADKRSIFAKLGRPSDGNGVSFWWFMFAATVLALLEAPINKFMLDNILRASNIESYVVSVFVTFAMLALAHHAGHLLRQFRSEYQECIYVTKVVVAAVILFILVACVSVLTIGRAFYSTATIVASGKEIFSEVGKQIAVLGFWQSLMSALTDNAALFLACLNTAGIAIAFLAAFTRYDSDKNYQAAIDAEKRAGKSLSRLENRYSSSVSKVAKIFSPKLAGVAAAYGAQTARLVALKSNRGAELSAEDQYDIIKEDILLSQARAELNQRVQSFSPAQAQTRSGEEAQAVLPLVVRERR